MNLQRRDSIVRMLKFIRLFYDLKPKNAAHTVRHIGQALQCSRTNARHWIDAAGYELPIAEVGTDEHHNGKGPAGITYGVIG